METKRPHFAHTRPTKQAPEHTNDPQEGQRIINLAKENVSLWDWQMPPGLERDHGVLSYNSNQKENDEWLWVCTSGKMIEIENNGVPAQKKSGHKRRTT